ANTLNTANKEAIQNLNVIHIAESSSSGDRGRVASGSEDEGRSAVREVEVTVIGGGTARLDLERGQANHCLPGVGGFVVCEIGHLIPAPKVDQPGLLELGRRRRPGRRFQFEGVIPAPGPQGDPAAEY